MKRHLCAVFVVSGLLLLSLGLGPSLAQRGLPSPATSLTEPLGAAFTYQGRLLDAGQPANGLYDFAFALFDQAADGAQIGTTIGLRDVTVAMGTFSVQLDFGASVFDGRALFLEIGVRPAGSSEMPTILAPRQPLTAAPYAVYALGAPWAGLTGVPAGFADNVDDDTTYSAGPGLVLSGTTFALAPAYLDEYGWRLQGNAGTIPGLHFLGTTDNVSLTLAVSGTAVLRLYPDAVSPNLIGGHAANFAQAGTTGVTIGGGGNADGPNVVLGSWGTVAGGAGNTAGEAGKAFVGGGTTNTAAGHASVVTGGTGNEAGGDYATVAGGSGNVASSEQATVGGGRQNRANGAGSVVAGGQENATREDHSTVGGGFQNVAQASYATVAGGRQNDISGYYGSIAGGYLNDVVGHYGVIGGGYGNEIAGEYGTIAGGGLANPDDVASSNRVTDDYGAIGGGGNNQAGDKSGTTSDARYATVAGGGSNMASALFSTVGGGGSNQARGAFSTIAGGQGNQTINDETTVGGGRGNVASGTRATVAGGLGNEASGTRSFVGGGDSNTAFYPYTSVAGGQSNRAAGSYATIAGGYGNQATADYATIAGGGRTNPDDFNSANFVTDHHGTVGGGGNNVAGNANVSITDAAYATVAGGADNTAGFQFATVGGGWNNDASGDGSVVAGGVGNAAAGLNATVAGGNDNSAAGSRAAVGGGLNNQASGEYSVVPGGHANEARGNGSFAAGTQARANNAGCFVWADNSTSNPVICSNDNRWVARAVGGVYFYTNAGMTTGVRAAPGGGSWSSVSDRNEKENVTPTIGQDVLARLAQIPISTWNYIAQDDSVRHIGPMAQDFYSAFHVGEDELHITTVDADGVALAAIQGLNQIAQEQSAELASLRAEKAELEKRVVEQESRLAALEGRLSRLESAGGAPARAAAPANWLVLGGLLVAGILAGPRLLRGGRR